MRSALQICTTGVLLFVSFAALASADGPIAGVSGVPAGGGFPAELTCQMCHLDSPLNHDDRGRIEVLGVPEKYIPGKSYRLTVKLSHPDATRWGFQLTAVAKTTFLGAGEFKSLPNDHTTQTRVSFGADGRSYIEHGGASKAATGIGVRMSFSWQFIWVAPAQDVGDVMFFGSGNMANGDGTNVGDAIYNPTPTPLAITKGGS